MSPGRCHSWARRVAANAVTKRAGLRPALRSHKCTTSAACTPAAAAASLHVPLAQVLPPLHASQLAHGSLQLRAARALPAAQGPGARRACSPSIAATASRRSLRSRRAAQWMLWALSQLWFRLSVSARFSTLWCQPEGTKTIDPAPCAPRGWDAPGMRAAWAARTPRLGASRTAGDGLGRPWTVWVPDGRPERGWRQQTAHAGLIMGHTG